MGPAAKAKSRAAKAKSSVGKSRAVKAKSRAAKAKTPAAKAKSRVAKAKSRAAKAKSPSEVPVAKAKSRAAKAKSSVGEVAKRPAAKAKSCDVFKLGSVFMTGGDLYITVVLPNCRLIGLYVKPTDDIAVVKAKLQAKLQTHEDFSLCIGGHRLVSGSVQDLDLHAGMIMTMHVDGKFVIYVDDGGGNRQLALLVDAGTSISQVKDMIEEAIGIGKVRLHLSGTSICRGGPLSEFDNIGSLQLKDGDVICLRVSDDRFGAPATPEQLNRESRIEQARIEHISGHEFCGFFRR
jgi:hypothetical protein